MLRNDQKNDLPEAANLILQHVSHLRMGKEGMVQYHFADEKAAVQTVAELKKDSRLTSLGIYKASSKHESCHHSLSDAKCHIIRVTPHQFESLWGAGSYNHACISTA